MSNEKEPVVHVYDDIVEEDNHLPNWWLFTLAATVVFGFGYWIVYHSAKFLPLPREEYAAKMEAAAAAKSLTAPPSDAMLSALAKDPAQLALAEKVFQGQCVACHGPHAEGLVGPNLTDKFWLHGGKPVQIYQSISRGYLDKGMPAWGPTLGDEKVKLAAAYVFSLKGKNTPGKAAQGIEEP
jgi:cytochrome c oxidase cbb3-type subunit 3